MVTTIIGRRIGDYQGTVYGHLFGTEMMDAPNLGVKPVTYKCTPASVANLVDEVNVQYDLTFNQYGKVVDIAKV